MGIWQQRLTAIADGSLTLPLVTQLLGLGRLTRWSEGYVEKEWKVDPGFCTGDGTDQQALFGGYLAALADQVLTFATMTVMDDDHAFKTAELQVWFFRPITEGTVRIVGRVVNRSRTLVHVRPSSIVTMASWPRKPQPRSWSSPLPRKWRQWSRNASTGG